jgi:hypothetical protein
MIIAIAINPTTPEISTGAINADLSDTNQKLIIKTNNIVVELRYCVTKVLYFSRFNPCVANPDTCIKVLNGIAIANTIKTVVRSEDPK